MANFLKKLSNSKAARDLIATVAPTLATALGGPLAGVATKAIAGKILGISSADDADILDAVLGAAPADLIKLKELEHEFARDMENAGIQMDEIAAKDRDSARKREVQTGGNTTSVLAGLFVLSYFALLAAMSLGYVPADIMANPAYLTILGTLTGVVLQVGNYYFGSSSGSRSKNKTIASMQGQAPS